MRPPFRQDALKIFKKKRCFADLARSVDDDDVVGFNKFPDILPNIPLVESHTFPRSSVNYSKGKIAKYSIICKV